MSYQYPGLLSILFPCYTRKPYIYTKKAIPRKRDLVQQKIDNTCNFKTPLGVAITDHKPERGFLRAIVKEEITNPSDENKAKWNRTAFKGRTTVANSSNYLK